MNLLTIKPLKQLIMKLRVTLLSVILLLCSFYGIRAQDTIPDLIISEVQLYGNGYVYVELTNRGNTALDLSKFALLVSST